MEELNDLDSEKMMKRLGVTPTRLHRFCVQRIMDAFIDDMTYDEKALQLIEDGDILPNEMAYLAVKGVHMILLEMEEAEKATKEAADAEKESE